MSERVLVCAAHPDDEALGCGGAIARHCETGDEVQVLFVADGVTARGRPTAGGEVERRRDCAVAALEVLGAKPPIFLNFADQRLDAAPLLDITRRIEEVATAFRPSMAYTHHAGDLNLDHQIVSRATLTALRPVPGQNATRIYGFEVLSSTEWAFGSPAFAPARFVNIAATFAKKMAALRCYDFEMRSPPHPRSYKTVEALAVYRGAAAGFDYAEAFTILREMVY